MSISSTATRRSGPSAGNGVTTVFPFTFKVFSATDLVVTLIDASDNLYPQVLTTQYTVSLNANQDANPGGSVTMLTPPPSGWSLVITSQVQSTQSIALSTGTAFPAQPINDALDRLTILAQDIDEQIGRALVVPWGSAITPAQYLALLPSVAVSASNAAASASAAATSASSAGASASAAAGSATSASNQVGLAAAQVTLATAQVALATTQAGNAATSATAAAGSATAAASSATAAASSATAASGSASAASNSATIAASYLTPVTGTSTTSLTIGVGSQSFTTQTGLAFVPGHPAMIAETSAAATNYMSGTVTSYNPATGAMVVNTTVTAGSGTHTDWTISLTPAATGPASALVTGNNYQVNSIGVGTPASGTAGDVKGSTGTFSSTVTASSFSGAGTGLTGTAASLTAGNATSATTANAVANAVTFNSGGSGAASGTTYNGGSAITISYNSIGAVPLNGALGTPSSGNLTNCTFPTLNQSTTGSSASCTGNSATATSATTATNLGGGSNGTIPYQSASGTTQMLAAGTSGYFLKSNGAAAPSWAAAPASGQLQVTMFFSSGTFTPATGVTNVRVTCIGGGAGGSSQNGVFDNGGGSGAVAVGTVAVTPGVGVTVTVGAGGQGTGTGGGIAGGASSFGTSIVAGGGGSGNNAVSGGAGGTVSTAGNIRNASGGTGSVGAGVAIYPASSGGPAAYFGGSAQNTNILGQAFSASSTYSVGAGGGTNGSGSAYGGIGGLVMVEWVG